MNTNTLKTFARQTRKQLRELVKAKLQFVLHDDTIELRANEKEILALRAHIKDHDEDYVIEEVAYTWFNRIMALRFMDANDYTSPHIVTPAQGQQRPEILTDALGGVIPEELQDIIDIAKANEILDGKTGEKKPQEALYRKLLVAECNYWGKFMPFLFEKISDYTELLLPNDLLSERSFVTTIRNGMSDEDCQQVEIIGWLYQFYIADKKKIADDNKSRNGGLTPDEIQAATQLFTPHWIVRYMVENSLGKLWLSLHPTSHLKNEMPYYIESPEGAETPIPDDIKTITDITFIDPCMGSGHVLVYAFDLFTKMYEEEGYTKSEIPTLIFKHNLFGLDIDSRCYQLTNFALTMQARKYYRRFLREEVSTNTMALQNIPKEIIGETGDFDKKSTMWLLDDVENLGSLIAIDRDDYKKIKEQKNNLFSNELFTIFKKETNFLSKKYHCTVTNPPYLGKGKNKKLTDFLKKFYPHSSKDLMATFIERCLSMNVKKGYSSMINMHNWMFISSYSDLRLKITEEIHIENILHLGRHTFPEIGGEKVQNAAFVIQNMKKSSPSQFIRLVNCKDTYQKERKTLEAINDKKCSWFYTTNQENFKRIPGSPIAYWVSEKIALLFERNKTLGEVGKARQGLATAKNNRFLRLWSEVNNHKVGYGMSNSEEALKSNKKWFPYNKGGEKRRWYGNHTYLVNWENNGYEIKHFFNDKGKLRSVIRNPSFYFKPAISWGDITSGGSSFRYYPLGFIFDVSGMSYFCPSELNSNTIIGSLNTNLYSGLTNIVNPTIHLQCGDVASLPACNIQDNTISPLVQDCIRISKEDWDAHEISWNFKSNELIKTSKSVSSQPLNECYDSYCAKWKELFLQLHTNEEELNRIFNEELDLQDEISSTVPLKDITILQQGEIKIEENDIVFQRDVIIKQLLSYLVGCFMGRYSVDKPGLIIADQCVDLKSLGLKIGGMDDTPDSTLEIDDDGILPLLEVPYFNDDVTIRIQDAIEKLFGKEYYEKNIDFINDALGKDLRKYMYRNFYKDHVKIYSNRPIYWMFSSAKGTFKALVYMHRLEPDTLSKMHADYVQPFISMLEQKQVELEELQIREDVSNREINKARKQSIKIQSQLIELRDFEQQLVEMASHRINLDLDKGVLENYPLFGELLVKITGVSKKNK